MVVEQTISLLKGRCQELIETLTIEDVRIGVWLTAVRLSDGSAGVASTLHNVTSFTPGGQRDYGELTPLKIRGRRISDILVSQKDTGIVKSLRMAVLNALSARFLIAPGYNIVEKKDPVDLIDIDSAATITIVGAFHSYVRRFADTGKKLNVLELNEESLPPEFGKYFVPADSFRSVVPFSDLVIITGQTLVNDTLDSLLDAVVPGTKVIVTGPSSSILPDVLFAKGVTIVGSLRISDPDRMFEIVSEGGAGYHLFQYCGEKISVLNGDSQVK
jgi:uncharacterized protein